MRWFVVAALAAAPPAIVTGTVVRVDGTEVTLAVKGKVAQRVTFDLDGVIVLADGKKAAPESIVVGDVGSVTFDPGSGQPKRAAFATLKAKKHREAKAAKEAADAMALAEARRNAAELLAKEEAARKAKADAEAAEAEAKAQEARDIECAKVLELIDVAKKASADVEGSSLRLRPESFGNRKAYWRSCRPKSLIAHDLGPIAGSVIFRILREYWLNKNFQAIAAAKANVDAESVEHWTLASMNFSVNQPGAESVAAWYCMTPIDDNLVIWAHSSDPRGFVFRTGMVVTVDGARVRPEEVLVKAGAFLAKFDEKSNVPIGMHFVTVKLLEDIANATEAKLSARDPDWSYTLTRDDKRSLRELARFVRSIRASKEDKAAGPPAIPGPAAKP